MVYLTFVTPFLTSAHSGPRTGAETFLNSLLNQLEFDIAMSMSSLRCLKLEATVRAKVAEALLPTSR